MERRVKTLIVLIVACLSTAVAAGAQDYSGGIIDREAVLKSAAEVTGDRYPNADVVQVDEFTRSAYEPNGTGVTWSDSYAKVLTEKGRRAQQSHAFSFLLPYSRVELTVLELIRPDGTVVPVDIAKQTKVMIDRSQMAANIYNPNAKVLRVGIPGVQIGDLVHIVVREDTMKRYMPDTWDDYQVFESTSPIKHGVYEVHAPVERPLRITALRDPVEGTVVHTREMLNGRTVYRWEVSDVPRFYGEPAMPPAYTVVQRLLVSTLPDWETISSWYWRLCLPHLEATTPEMREMVDKLTEGLTDRQAKIEAIFRWASQQVRYMGITIEDESPGWEPHDVKMTFENRHGVCRDKAALLVAMLRLAGFEAYPVLIDVGPKKDAEIPIVRFNHAITAVREEDGSYQLMDCTDETTRDLLPTYLCNCSYVVAHPDGETLQTAPIVPAEENMAVIETTGEIDADGNLTGATEVQFAGINDNAYRGYFARVKPEQRRQFFEGVLKASMGTATLTRFEIKPANLQDMSESLSLRMEFSAEDILVGDESTRMMPVPQIGTNVGLVNFIIRQTGLKKRRFPMQTNYACGVRETLRLKVDPAVGAFSSLPEFTPIEDEAISWKRELEQDVNGLVGRSAFAIKVVELSPVQYLTLKDSLKEIEYNERKMPILARQTDEAPETPDVVVLSRHAAYDLASATSWTERHRVKKKVLTYKGKKDNAEIKLDYNPAWEEVELVRATVTNDGQSKEVSADEINLMDASWVASAPRYPAAKTLVAALPAVKIGSVIEYEFVRRRKDRPFFATMHVFRSFDAVEEYTVELTAPDSLALSILRDDNGITIPDDELTGGGEPVIVEHTDRVDGRTVCKWHVRDQAAVKREDSMPPLSSFSPTLRISTGQWKLYARQVGEVLRRAAGGQKATEQKARELTRDLARREEKIIAVRDFVAKQIRAAGPGCDDMPLEAVTPADRTLADGYGNTTDRAVLLYAMLDALGFDPEFLLANYAFSLDVLQQFETDYPHPNAFGSVLVRVVNDAEALYLNDTNQYAELGTTPVDGHLVLPLRDGEVETASVAADKEERRQYEYRLAITQEGHANVSMMRRSFGTSFGSRRKMYAEMPPEERNRYYQELVATISQAAIADGDLRTDFDSYPGTESFAVHVERYVVRDGDFLYFELPRSLGHLFGLRSDTHENPFYRGGDSELTITTVVELPKGFSEVVIAPAQKQWQLPGDGGTVRVSVSTSTNADSGGVLLTVTHDVELDAFILDPDRYAELVAIERQLSHPEARTVLVARPQ